VFLLRFLRYAAEGVMTKRRSESEETLSSAVACGAPYGYRFMKNQCHGQGLVIAVACWLQDMVSHYDSLEWTITSSGLQRTNAFPVSAFHGRPLSVSIENFIQQICKGAQLDDSIILVAAVYLSRIVEKANGELPVSSCTVHRLLLQAITLAAKFMLDHPRSNKVMAAFADLTISKFNELEVKFLCAIQYTLVVSLVDMELAEDALQIVRCTTYEHARGGKRARTGDTPHNNSNRSSIVGGVAACNNSIKSEAIEVELNQGEEEVLLAEASNSGNTKENRVEVAPNNYNDVMTAALCECETVNPVPSCTQSMQLCVMSPQRESSVLVDSKLSTIKPAQCSMCTPPKPTKMSTPERRGVYTLIAIAAE